MLLTERWDGPGIQIPSETATYLLLPFPIKALARNSLVARVKVRGNAYLAEIMPGNTLEAAEGIGAKGDYSWACARWH
jgi:hypothetical protein